MAGKYEIDMCSGSLFPKIVKFSIPVILTSLLQLLYNAVDIIVVGRYVGSTALAAVGSTSSLINLIVNAFIGLSVGTGVLLAQNVGANDYDKAHDAVHTAMLTSLVGGIMVSIFGFFSCRALLHAMGSPDDVIDQATLYMKIYFLGMPAFMIYTFGSVIMRTVGDTKRPLFFLSISGLVNVVLNLITVIKFDMGVAGVAIATIVSQDRHFCCAFPYKDGRDLPSLSKGIENSRSYITENGENWAARCHSKFHLFLFKRHNPVVYQLVWLRHGGRQRSRRKH